MCVSDCVQYSSLKVFLNNKQPFKNNENYNRIEITFETCMCVEPNFVRRHTCYATGRSWTIEPVELCLSLYVHLFKQSHYRYAAARIGGDCAMFLVRHICRPTSSVNGYKNTVEAICLRERSMWHRVLTGFDHDQEAHDDTTSPDDFSDETVKNRGKPVRLVEVIEEKNRAKQPFCSYELFCQKSGQVYRKYISTSN